MDVSVAPTYPTLKQVEPTRWQLTAPVYFNVDRVAHQVPAGFVTDGASVPRFLWSLFPPMSKYTNAAVVHDFLYATRGGSRKRADRIFLEAMLFLEVGSVRARIMYRAVRLFGGQAWKN